MSKKKTEWFEVFVEERQILAKTEKSTLIMMSPTSKFAGWKFWLTNKLVGNEFNHRVKLLLPDSEMPIYLTNGKDKKVIPSRAFRKFRIAVSTSTE